MHCNCEEYFSVIAWKTLEDLQNYSNYSRLHVISNYSPSSVSQTILHQQITKSKSSPGIRFLLRKPESGSYRTQPESWSKKSKIQSMHTFGARLLSALVIKRGYAMALSFIFVNSSLRTVKLLKTLSMHLNCWCFVTGSFQCCILLKKTCSVKN